MSLERSRGKARRAGRGLASILALSVAFLILDPSRAKAQFNAHGRGRQPAPAPSQKPAPKAQNKSPTAAPKAMAPGSPAGAAEKEAEKSRDDVLIARYRGLIISQPGEEVPLKRLAELVRKRDGDLKSLLSDVEKQATEGPEGERYGALVAWAGLLVENGQAKEALEPLKRATAFAKDQAAAWLLQGRIQESLDKKEEAISSYEHALPLVKGPDELFLLRRLRGLCLDLSRFDEASSLQEKLEKKARDSSFVQGELGRELSQRGHHERALEEFRAVEKRSRGDYRAELPALVDLGSALLRAGKHKESLEVLQKAARLSSSQPGQLHAIELLQAEAHQAQGTLDEFFSELEEKNSASSQSLLGRLYEQEGHTDKAISAYRRVLQLDKGDIDTELRLVRLLELTGDLEGALASYRTLTRSAKTDVDLSIRYMNMLLSQGERAAAIAEWDRIERATARDVDAGLLLVDFAERLDETERARALLNRLFETSSGDPRFLVELGSRYFKRGDTVRAKKIWNRIPETHRDRPSGYVLLGEVLIDHDSLDEGLLAIEKGVTMAPSDAGHLKSLALAQERAASQSQDRLQAKFEQAAIQTYLKLLTLPKAETEKVFARRHLVRLWQRRSELRREVARLKKSVEQKDPDLDAARLLAEAYQREGDSHQAILMLELVLSQVKGDRQSLLQLVALYEKMQNYPQMVSVLQRLVEADPMHAREYYERLARASRASGKADEALRYAELGVQQSSGDPEALVKLAELYLSQGQLDKAEHSLRKALSRDDHFDRANLLLSDLLAQTKRPGEAFERLLQVLRRSPDPQLIALSGRRLLGLASVLGETRKLEDDLRKLTISRPEQGMYRALLVETLSSELYPLELTQNYGTPEEARKAADDLEQLARRNLGPLLLALSGDKSDEQKFALRLLSYDESAATQSALLSVAQSAGAPSLRLQAVLGIRSTKNPDIFDQLQDLVVQNGRARRDPVALAGAWVLSRSQGSTAKRRLFSLLDVKNPEVEGIALLGLAEQETWTADEKAKLKRYVEQNLKSDSVSPLLRDASILAWGALLSRDRGVSFAQEISDSVAGSTESTERQLALIAISSAYFGQERPRPVSIEQFVASNLLDPDPALAHAAFLALSPPKRPLRIIPNQLSADSLSLSAILNDFIDSWAAQPKDDDAAETARTVLGPQLLRLAQTRLRSDQRAAKHVLFLLGQGQLLATFRDALKDDILPLALPASPIAAEAIVLLRPHDGAEARQLLRAALESSGTEQAAMLALGSEASAASLSILAAFESRKDSSSAAPLSWSVKRRLAQTYRAILRHAEDPAVKNQAQTALSQLSKDPNPLVQSAARGDTVD